MLHSLVHRPYVFLPFALFAVAAIRHVGVRRWLAMTGVGYSIAWASELCSIHTGFPYGRYSYLSDALAGDLLVLGVPFFDSLSYTFLAYFGWTTAMLLVGPARRRSWSVPALAGCLTTGLDVVIDPLARIGDRWFLGRIFEYQSEGPYFGVPLSNFAGWLLVATAIAAGYRWIEHRGGGNPGLLGPLGYLSIALFGIVLALALGETRLALAGTLLQLPIWLWMAARLRHHPQESP